MSLEDINLKRDYSSDKDNILFDFYIPALSNSVKYYRLAGFFSSSALAIAARGISKFIYNNGIMKLICGAKLYEEDIKAIEENNSNYYKVIEEALFKELNFFEDILIKEHFRALGWMVANKKLEIKIAVIYDENKKILDNKKISDLGIFHQKVGVLEDNSGNKLSFSGSINETAKGWLDNVEEFKVFRSWVDVEMDYLKADINKFKKFWNSSSERLMIFDLPIAIRDKLISIAPKKYSELNLEKLLKKYYISKNKIKLRKYQKDAIQNWLDNGRKGIFEMATGTGKTFTALGCVKEIYNEYDNIIVIISTPQGHLIHQWKEEIEKFGLDYDELIIADSTNHSWKKNLFSILIKIYLGDKDKIIILSTHDTLCSKDFIKIIDDNKKNTNIMLIGDEVHGIGSKERKRGLIDEYDMRLGLSATPKRWFDDQGTKLLYDYFNDIVFEFSLSDAINTINPDTNKTYLTPYRYMPKLTNLSDDELYEYVDKTRSIINLYNRTKIENEKEEVLERLLFKRADIIKNAINKYNLLEDILNKLKSNLKYTLIYCSPQQIDRVMKIIKKYKITAHRFTMEEGTKPEKKFNGLSERDYILKLFSEGKYQVLVAMKCLDEGVDIPPARTAIIMASSSNPREYIQRIGRVIRRYPGKEEAIIYDMIVVPSYKNTFLEFEEIEMRILNKELKRYEEIAKIAINNIEALKIIYNI